MLFSSRLAAESKQGQEALLSTFYYSLADSINDDLASCVDVKDLETLISSIIRLENHLQECIMAESLEGTFSVPSQH